MKKMVLALLLLVCMLPVCVLAQTYTVHFEANGGTGTMDPVPVEAGTEYTLPQNGFTAPEGQLFYKWRVRGMGLMPGDTIDVDSDVTVYAEWANEISSVTYLSCYEEDAEEHVVPNLAFDTWHDLLTYGDCGFTAPEGCVFGGWLMIESGSDGDTWIETEFPFGGSVHMTRDFTFAAKWIDENTPLYTMSFDLNGGKIIVEDEDGNDMETSVLESSEAWEDGWFELPNPDYLIAPDATKAFSYWQVGDHRYTYASVQATGNMTAKAIWKTAGEPTTFTVSFDANGGTGTMDSVTVQYYGDDAKDTLYTLPECTFTAPEGMRFKQWLLDGEEPRNPGSKFIPYQDTVVVADWEEPMAYVHFHQGIENGEGMYLEIDEGADVQIKTYEEYGLPLLEGKVFENWFSGNLNQKFYPGDWLENATGDIDMGACWVDDSDEIRVTYKAFDGPTSPLHFAFADDEGNHTVLGNIFYGPGNGEFAGWTRESDDETFEEGDVFALEQDETLIANWSGADVLLTFKSYEGEEQTGTDTYVDYGTDYELAEPSEYGITTPAGKKFSHWFAEINGVEYDLKAGDMVEGVTGDIEFVALWRDNGPAVYLIPNDGSDGDPLKYTVESGASFELKHPSEYDIDTPEGKFFWGWYDGDRDKDYEYEGETIIIENITEAHYLGAVWKDTHVTLTFHANNEMDEPVEKTVEYGTEFTLPNPGDEGYGFTTPDSHVFSHWYVTDEWGFEADWDEGHEFIAQDDMDLGAVWRDMSPAVYLIPNDGSEDDPLKFVVNSGENFVLKHPNDYGIETPAGMYFWGWYDGDNDVDYEYDGEDILIENITEAIRLGAVWKKNNYTMTFTSEYNGETQTATETAARGSAFYFEHPEDHGITTPEGMIIDGYYCVEHDEFYRVNDVIEPVDEDLEFIVSWRDNSPNIFLWPNNDIEEGPVKVDVGEGGSHVLGHPTQYNITTPEDKVFWGWYDGDLEKDYEIGDTVEIDDSAVYLGAVWKDTHVKLTFRANNGTGDTDEVLCEFGDIFIVPGNGGDDDLISFEAPEGMVFDYWYITNEWDEEVDWQVGEEYEVVDPLTFTAIWRYDFPGIYFHQGVEGGEGVHIELEYGDMYVIRTMEEYGLEIPEIDEEWAENGVVFTHWHNGFTGEDLYPGDVIEVTGAVDAGACYAGIFPEEFAVTYKSDRGPEARTHTVRVEEEEDGQGVQYTVMGEIFNAPEGMAFVGWRPEEGGPRIEPGAPLELMGDVVLYAEFVPDTYTVILEANDGTGATYAYEIPYDQDFIAPGGLDGELPFPLPEGKELWGWLMLNSGDEVDAGMPVHGSDTITLRALWIDAEADTAPLTLVGNITENGQPVSETHDIPLGAEFTLPLAHQVGHLVSVGEDEVLRGWQIGETLYAENARLTLTEETTATAVVVSADQATKYSMVFSGNGASGHRGSLEISLGVTITMPVNPYVVPEGKAFGGWKIGETIYQEGQIVAVSEAMLALANEEKKLTATAVWNDTEEITYYTVSFDAGEGSGAMSDVRVPAGSSYTLPMSEFEAPEHHTFYNWLIGEEDECNPGNVRVIEDDLTLTAEYGPASTPVRYYDPETGASYVHSDLDLLYGQAHKVLTPDQCYFSAPEGKVFASWAQVDDESGIAIRAIVPGSQYDEVEVTDDFCLHATWVEDASAVYKMYVKEKQDEDPIWRDTSDGGYFRTPDPDVVEIPENKEIDYWDVYDMDGELLMTAESGEYVPATCDAVFAPVFKDRMVRVTYRFMLDSWATYVTGSMAAGREHTTLRPEEIFDMPDGMIFDCWLVVDKESEEIISQINPYGQYNTIAAGDDYELAGNWVSDTDNRFVLSIDENGSPDGNPGPDSVPAGGYYLIPGEDFLTPPVGREFDHYELTMGGETTTVEAGQNILATADATLKPIWKAIEIRIDYEPNGSPDSWECETFDYGEEYTLRECTWEAPTGHEFDCWMHDGQRYEEGYTFVPTEDMEFTAQWKPLPYIVTLRPNGGVGNDVPKTFYYGETYYIEANIFAAPEGKRFAGWQLETTGETYVYDEANPVGIPVTGDLSFKALWEDIPVVTYIVSFLPGDGSGAMESVTAGETYTLPQCSFDGPEGHDFAGWLVDGKVRQTGEEITLTTDTALTAQWKIKTFTVTYLSSDEADAAKYETDPMNYGTRHTILSIEDLADYKFGTPNGYKFAGWLLVKFNEDGSFKVMTTFGANEQISMKENRILIADWQDLTQPKHKIYIDLNGGSVKLDNEIVTEMDPGEAYADRSFELPPASALIAPEGKEFAYWYVSNGERYEDREAVPASQDGMTATVIWKDAEAEETFVVVFKPGEGSGKQFVQGVDKRETLLMPACSFTAPEGYEFGGWMVEELDKTTWLQAGEPLTVPSDLTITAQWQKKTYQVSFTTGEGTGEMETITAAHGESFNLPECGFTAAAGREFAGWLIGGEVKQAGDPVSVTEITTVTAQWKDIIYTVTVKAGDGEGDDIVIDRTYGQTYTLTNCGFTAPEGYHFTGWLVSGEIKQPSDVITVTGNVEVTAQYAINEYTVTVKAGDGTGTDITETRTHGEGFTLPTFEATKFTAPVGKDFSGWNVGGEVKQPGSTVIVKGETTVTAIYGDAILEVSFAANGGTGTMNPVDVVYGSSYKLPECGFVAPANMVFDTWRVGGERKEPGETITVTENTEITAEWAKSEFTVTLNADNDAGESKTITVKFKESFTLPECDFTPDYGMTFSHWQHIVTTPEGTMTEDCDVGAEFTKVAADLTFKAVWTELGKYEVSFDANGGEGEMTSEYIYAGYDYELPEFDDTGIVPPEGKQFKAWSVGGTEYAEGASITINAATTVKALWTEAELTVSFLPGDCGSGTMANDTAFYGLTYTLPKSGFSYSTENYVFTGWNVGGEIYGAGDTVILTEDTEITAQWANRWYTMTLINSDDNTTKTQTVEYGKTFTLPTAESLSFEPKTHYEFGGWQSAGGMSYPEGGTISGVKMNLTFTTIWTQMDSYTVRFDANGGSDEMTEQTAWEGEAFKLPECGFTAPAGKVFKAWSYNGTEYEAGSSAILTGDLTFKAVWDDIIYKVTVKAGDGEGEDITVSRTYNQTYTLTNCGFTAPTGYHFTGWLVSGEIKQPSDVITVTGDVEVTAQYAINVYEVKVLPGDGTGTAIVTEVEHGETYTLPTFEAAGFTAPVGKDFSGWNVGGVPTEAGKPVTVTSAMTVTALYGDAILEVSFAANGGTGTMDPVDIVYGSSYTLPECGFTAPADMVFDTWKVGIERKEPGETVTVTEDTVITAQWAKSEYTVILNADNDEGEKKTYTVKFEESFTLPECDFTPDYGMTFSHWQLAITTPDGPVNEDHDVGDVFVPVKADLTFKAVWTELGKLEVSFDENGGSGEMESEYVYVGYDYELPVFDDTGIVPPEGKQFKAWSVNGTEYAEGASITINARTTVKALWTEAELAVNFLPGDCGSSTMATETAYYGVAYKLPANGFSYEADKFVFTGWNVNGKVYGVGDTVILKADTDITAQWADRWYKITYVDINDTERKDVKSFTVEYGDTYPLLHPDDLKSTDENKPYFKPANEDYHIFDYWERFEDNEQFRFDPEYPEAVPTISGVRRNMEFIANWTFGRIVEVEVEVEVKDEVTGETTTVTETVKVEEKHDVVAQPAPVDQNDEQVMNTTDPDQIPDEQLSDMLKKLQENTAPEGGTVEEAQIKTVQDVVDALHEAINGEVSEDEEPEYPVESIVVQDIIPVLEIKQNGVVVNTIKVTDPSLFPGPKGLEVSIEIPEGTDPRTHQYKITHMLTEDAWDNSGLKAGDIEVLEVSGYDLEAGTLKMWMKYFSPVAIANKEKPAEVIIPGNIDLPETGDPSSLLAWVTLLGASGIGLTAIKRKKK